ncbi:MAG: OFA family MFS transporter [Kiritimatiellae bacterium]|nr:OFA family MFS transporter [Kiritimatiellia bacterium]
MATRTTIDGETIKSHGLRVTLAGLGINLALGVLYSWSIISSAIKDAGWGWTAEQRALPYSIACLVFCLVMVPAGRMQDKLGPRLVASLGGVLVGLGMILASFSTSTMGYVLGFGVLAGAGIGFGYASATPPSVKWFPAAKTGMIAGVVVSGFGLASVYAAPLSRWLAASFGLKVMMMSLGIGFLVVVVALAQLLRAPHKALKFEGTVAPTVNAEGMVKKEDFTPGEMLKTVQFYLLWFMYACGAGAGLMIISMCKKINAKAGVGVLAVVALAIGNGGGRIIAGMLSDKLGRQLTMFLFFVAQAIVIVALALVGGKEVPPAVAMIVLSALVGANYGSNLALFPSATKDYYGLKNFGMNYGLVFTAWGIGGFILAQFAARVYDGKIVPEWAGSYSFAFYTSAVLLLVAAVMTFIVKPPHHHELAEA